MGVADLGEESAPCTGEFDGVDFLGKKIGIASLESEAVDVTDGSVET